MPTRQIIRPAEMPVPHPTFTPALRFGRWVFVSGAMATDFANGLVPEVLPGPAGPNVGEDPVLRESRHILGTLAMRCEV